MRRLLLLATLALAACQRNAAPDFERAEPDEALSGGATTLLKLSKDEALAPDALSQPAANLTLEQRAHFAVGNSFFTTAWIPAPASTQARDGLGPLFNAAACQSCHIKDGRGRPPRGDEPPVSMIVKLGPKPDSHFGEQLQDFALPGLAAETRIKFSWEETTLHFKDGEAVQLRKPRLEFTGLAAPLDAATRHSLRMAPPMIGLGLLQLIPEQDLLSRADPDDRDGDGISGRLNRVPDRATGQSTVGRFGWKAAQPSVRQQAAGALMHDMGLTSTLFPADDCAPTQTACREAVDGGAPEVSEEILGAIDFYARHLAVPARRWVDTQEVLAGKRAFHQAGCVACHTPSQRTGSDPLAAELSGQTIRPYSDLLLHDMGPGLADELPEFEAAGSEWRTPPLWGLHLAAHVSGTPAYLHDGRARTLMEAVLWHEGEARAAREQVLALPKAEREALIWFLKSL